MIGMLQGAMFRIPYLAMKIHEKSRNESHPHEKLLILDIHGYSTSAHNPPSPKILLLNDQKKHRPNPFFVLLKKLPFL